MQVFSYISSVLISLHFIPFHIPLTHIHSNTLKHAPFYRRPKHKTWSVVKHCVGLSSFIRVFTFLFLSCHTFLISSYHNQMWTLLNNACVRSYVCWNVLWCYHLTTHTEYCIIHCNFEIKAYRQAMAMTVPHITAYDDKQTHTNIVERSFKNPTILNL